MIITNPTWLNLKASPRKSIHGSNRQPAPTATMIRAV